VGNTPPDTDAAPGNLPGVERSSFEMPTPQFECR